MSMYKHGRHATFEDNGLRIPDSDRAQRPPLSIPVLLMTDHDAAAEHHLKAAPQLRKRARDHTAASPRKAKNHAG